MRRLRLLIASAALLTAISCAAFAPFQRVPIDTAPRDAVVFIDGHQAGKSPMGANLRADRDHVVFLKREGYRPELVVIETQRPEGRPRLEPPEVLIQLVPLDKDRDLQVEIEPPPDERAPDPGWYRDR
jgi:hypothetical protein